MKTTELASLRFTSNNKILGVLRIIAGIPLLGIGAQHIAGTAPMLPILQAANIPLPELNAVVAPIFQVLAGLMLISGFHARIAGLLAIGMMAVATYTHLVADWADEPPIFLPLVILAIAIWVVIKGAGAFSLDRKSALR